ncbi:MAG: hypothetical protein LUE16_07205, partial [Lachnospiraceae bacterium]|nr:hypothetical protein [Lachnospiraceae bacterium]
TANETEATGHTWDEGTVTTAATSTTSGVKTYTCTECGETYTEEIQATGSTEDNSDATTSPQTGDNSHLWLWIVLILSGGSCMICISSVRRRKNR